MDWIALLSGLVGVMIGSLTSIVTLLVQNAYQNRRESQRLIFDTAFKDYELRFRYASEGTPQRASFPYPLNPKPLSFNDTHLPCPMTM